MITIDLALLTDPVLMISTGLMITELMIITELIMMILTGLVITRTRGPV